MMNKFAFLLDPLFLICVALYGVNRCAEHFGFDHWLLRGYLNDFICIAFWMPIVTYTLHRLRLRDDAIPHELEIAVAFLIWSLMFEVWLPNTVTFANLTTADHWDVVCYATGGVLAGAWWRWYYIAESFALQPPETADMGAKS